MHTASLMSSRMIQLPKAPSLSKLGRFRDALSQQFSTTHAAISGSGNIRRAMK
jgi:hypothetical protein